jgi:hypothetical protein
VRVPEKCGFAGGTRFWHPARYDRKLRNDAGRSYASVARRRSPAASNRRPPGCDQPQPCVRRIGRRLPAGYKTGTSARHGRARASTARVEELLSFQRERARACPGVDASLTRPSFVMKGFPVRVRAPALKVLLRDVFCCRVRRRGALHYPEKGIGRAVTCREFAPKVLERLASSGGPRLWAWPPETESAHPTRFTHSVGRTG